MKASRGILWLTCCGLLAGAELAAQPTSEGAAPPPTTRPARSAPDSKEQIERRLASVSLLIEKSSAARQIESSGNPDSLALRDKARQLLVQADQAYRSGELASASQLLTQASKLVYDGARLAAPAQINDEKKRSDFDARMVSVKALLAAQQRVGAGKTMDAGQAEIAKKIEAEIQQANALAAANQLDQAMTVLDQACAEATTALAAMNSGQTKTRSVHFANPQEEYRYELERGDANLTLVNTLLKDKRASDPAVQSSMQQHVELAARLRSEAAGAAAKGDYASAIKLQENSNVELVSAIRSAGIAIPG